MKGNLSLVGIELPDYRTRSVYPFDKADWQFHFHAIVKRFNKVRSRAPCRKFARLLKRKSGSECRPVLHPRFRIVCQKEIAFGPGKADLLEFIAETGSIGKAASRMKMSYMRAWSLVQMTNRSFRKPLVLATHGGPGGGAELTEAGRRMLALYRQMERQAAAATEATWKDIHSYLKP